MVSRNMWLILLVVILPSLSGCEENVGIVLQPDTTLERRIIDSVGSEQGLTGRSILACPAGDCIVFHYPIKNVSQEDLAVILEGDPDSEKDNVELFYDENNNWTRRANYVDIQSTFNCCTFAFGDVAGLTTSDWIAPNPSGETENTVPMQIILDSFFQLVRVYKGPITNWEIIHEDKLQRENDVICYVPTRYEPPAFLHVGKISKKNDRNWLISKLGAGPIVRATIETMANYYHNEFDEIRVYRKKPGSAHSSVR
jgi:hypothetical protein